MIVDQIVKSPGEVSPHTMDFSKLLVADETIETVAVTSRQGATGADTTGAFLAGAPIVAGTTVTQTFQAGAHGETQIVRYLLTSSLGRAYDPEIEVRIRAH